MILENPKCARSGKCSLLSVSPCACHGQHADRLYGTKTLPIVCWASLTLICRCCTARAARRPFYAYKGRLSSRYRPTTLFWHGVVECPGRCGTKPPSSARALDGSLTLRICRWFRDLRDSMTMTLGSSCIQLETLLGHFENLDIRLWLRK